MLAHNKHALFPTENLEVCRREYAEPKALAEAISQAALGNVEQASGLLSLLSLERWLRSITRIETSQSMLKRSCNYELKTGASAPLCPSEQSTHNSDRPVRNRVESRSQGSRLLMTPLHGSGRAGFPHPALALGDDAHAA